ncbi:hypothetical protein GCM10009802_51100 [Streptomyces synnematoformans]|uniref:Uncharacterized protein n=1 Tax=Streptomyces synnematoformans TaxID=415721 RepID=A0ABN2ZE15_9ACTN
MDTPDSGPLTQPSMTLRVSRDSGRRWGRQKRFYARDCEPLDTLSWPPCRCPRCRRGKP